MLDFIFYIMNRDLYFMNLNLFFNIDNYIFRSTIIPTEKIMQKVTSAYSLSSQFLPDKVFWECTYECQTYFERTVPIWNALIDDTVTAQSLTMFKHKPKGLFYSTGKLL